MRSSSNPRPKPKTKDNRGRQAESSSSSSTDTQQSNMPIDTNTNTANPSSSQAKRLTHCRSCERVGRSGYSVRTHRDTADLKNYFSKGLLPPKYKTVLVCSSSETKKQTEITSPKETGRIAIRSWKEGFHKSSVRKCRLLRLLRFFCSAPN
jgi:hypothetical protein